MTLPSDLPSTQTLLAHFQARYPHGSLVTELLTIHQSNYIVRASVQMGNVTLATGMAAAPEIELAEDRAKSRVLMAIGISSSASTVSAPMVSTPPPIPLPSLHGQAINSLHASNSREQQADVTPLTSASVVPEASLIKAPLETPPIELAESLPIASFQEEQEETEIPELKPSFIEPSTLSEATRSPSVALDLTALTDFSADFPVEEGAEISPDTVPLLHLGADLAALAESSAPEIDWTEAKSLSDPTLNLTTASALPQPKEKPSKRKTEAAETPLPLPASEPNDRSGEIARIGIEMKRLGWSTAQGREHLKRTYGKRSRQELNDTELLDFLSYLESQPSPLQSPF